MNFDRLFSTSSATSSSTIKCRTSFMDLAFLTPNILWTHLLIYPATQKKSACLRYGPRFKNVCANVMVSGLAVNWIISVRYLGVYWESSFTFKCTFVTNKRKFYQAFNSIFGQIGRIASEEVIFALIKIQQASEHILLERTGMLLFHHIFLTNLGYQYIFNVAESTVSK